MDRTLTVKLVREWVKLDEEITAAKRAVKLLAEKKKELTEELVSIMKDNQIDEFDLSDGKIVRNSTKQRSGLSKKFIAGSLYKFFNDEGKAMEASNFIYAERQELVKDKIVRKRAKEIAS
jgi:hypothetical protein